MSSNVKDRDPIYLESGEPAPFSGDLWPAIRSLRLVMRSEICTKRSKLMLEHAKAIYEIELQYLQEQRDISDQANAERIEKLGVWYRQPWFIATVTALSVVAAMLATGYMMGLIGGT